MTPADLITLRKALRFVKMARQTLDPLLSKEHDLINADLKLVSAEVALEDALEGAKP